MPLARGFFEGQCSGGQDGRDALHFQLCIPLGQPLPPEGTAPASQTRSAAGHGFHLPVFPLKSRSFSSTPSHTAAATERVQPDPAWQASTLSQVRAAVCFDRVEGGEAPSLCRTRQQGAQGVSVRRDGAAGPIHLCVQEPRAKARAIVGWSLLGV